MIQEERVISRFIFTAIHRVAEDEREISRFVRIYGHIQSDSRGKVNILGDVVSVIVRKEVHMNTCLILNTYLDTAV